MNIVSDNLFEEGYDSDGQMGPLYEHGVSDEEFFTMIEDEPVREIEMTPAPKFLRGSCVFLLGSTQILHL